ncbi:hypothetical protein [Paenibacillus sp. BR1-192]|uniref:hypothetical protein n=1 Tax=Paenibacillus sp. BR1-192 TaxID=3032287 RepID=UPI00240E7DC7|nr:hypothetical protein [Paenibacillus sp. BR1-192]WFB57365.1 hypothetical protein P0X86_25875 [Paenibacillus sp. BR1-192]
MREQFMRGLRRVNVGSSKYVSFLQSLLSPNFWIVCQGMKFGSKGDRSAFRNRFVLSAASMLMNCQVTGEEHISLTTRVMGDEEPPYA